MADVQATEETTPAQNIPASVREAMALIEKGSHKEAAELLIQEKLQELPDGHPSKGPFTGVIHGDDVSHYSKFEDLKDKIRDSTKFMSVMKNVEDKTFDLHNGVLFYFMQQHPELMNDFSNYMLDVEENRKRSERGEPAIAPGLKPSQDE